MDAETGLMWAARNNGKDINWQDARDYCENYPFATPDDFVEMLCVVAEFIMIEITIY